MESFVKIFDHLHEFRYQSSLETWMRRIVVNNSINKLRSFKFTESIDDQVFQIGFDDKAFDQLNEKELLKMLESLPVGYRTVFNMYAIEGYSHKEISDTLGIDEGTSRSQLAKARKTLQDMVMKTERSKA
jgi:RNA polymerase sigma-70 factor (ECF subfamily)